MIGVTADLIWGRTFVVRKATVTSAWMGENFRKRKAGADTRSLW